MSTSTDALTHLQLVSWFEPGDGVGHDPRSSYAEQFWLPVLGPSAVWFLRSAQRELDAATTATPALLDLTETARQLGLGHRGGRHSPLMRTVERCINFGVARFAGEGVLAIRSRLPPVPRHLLGRLPLQRREEIRRWQRHRPGVVPDAHLERTAMVLFTLGHGLHETAERLIGSGITPERAHQVAARAWAHHSPQADRVTTR